MRAVALIARKRDGGALTAADWRWLVAGYLRAEVGEAQMAALLMAGTLQGFAEHEARALTDALVASGERLDLSGLPGPTVDKHSTGGVSDSTTLLVAPLLAAAGARVVKLAGRGLGHTGGTIDKLDAVPGLRTALEPAALLRVAAEVGCVVAAQSERLVPADRALYALRDETATVPAPALIAASVMAKKLAVGASTIVLDVKAGDGAFLPTVAAAERLARLCVSIGSGAGRYTLALITAMDQPLGRAVGSALEVREAVDLLRAPPRGRLAGLAVELAGAALSAAGADGAAVGERLRRLWASGAALERLGMMIAAQGGDPAVCERPARLLPSAPVVREVSAAGAGVVEAVPARAVGELAVELGAGRARRQDRVDPAVGLRLAVEVGDTVTRGAPLGWVHARDDEQAERAGARLRALVRVGDGPAAAPATVLRRVGR